MEEQNFKPQNPAENKKDDRKKFGRREILKSLLGIPVLGLLIQQILHKNKLENYRKNEILSELGMDRKAPSIMPQTTMKKPGQLIRLGIIGFGTRGEQLARSSGFAHPEWIDNLRNAANRNKRDKRLQTWLNQEDLNIAITGICDVFDLRAEKGVTVSKNNIRPGGTEGILEGAKRYRTYQELLQSSDIDAVIVTTPDHHHAQISIDAVKAGKHVYCEKCMTRTEEEVYKVEEAVKRSSVVFQVGHQYTQNYSYVKAKELIEKNILGKITLVMTTANRNTPDGAWIRHLDSKGNPKPGDLKTIDWDQWLGFRPKVPFSTDRYYNWTKWWDYATGLSGQLLCHEYDAVNQLLGLGIPKRVVSSGGIYFFKDNREIPDIFNVIFEFPDKDVTLVYSATLANSRYRGKVFMGHDASMEIGAGLKITVDRNSTRYKAKLQNKIIDPSLPLFTYTPGLRDIEAVTSATEQYYQSAGLLYTYREGKQVDISHLHIKEWLESIRTGSKLSCPIDKGIEVTIACHMATRSYLEKRPVQWDPVKKRIV
ncbi:Gfo/Idh/MocA family protein [candidate division KSB1 bacterium]